MSAQAHTRDELDEWVAAWVIEADDSLSPSMVAEIEDMAARHLWYFDPQPIRTTTRTVRTSWSGSVEHWRPLIETYFAADQVATAMRVMNCETGGTGNPNSYNTRSGASGLFQHLPKYWADRSAKAGWGGADIMDPVANVAVAAWLAKKTWSHWTCY